MQLLDEVKKKFGKLHVVVNNAGIKTFAKASDAPIDVWTNAIEVNLNAIYHSVARDPCLTCASTRKAVSS